mgnify:CR=1 FL=1|jgi:hypothetical protein
MIARYRLTASIALVVPRMAWGEEATGITADNIIQDGIDWVVGFSELFPVFCGVLGIALVAWSIFQIAAEPDDPDRWKHVAAGLVGSLFTIIAVIVGWSSVWATG